MDAVTSADMAPFMASNPAASAPNPGTPTWIASMNPAQNRTGSASALSQDSHDVTPGDLASAQFDSSTLFPAPADDATTVSRRPAPAVSRSINAGLATKVAGSVVGRNFARANRRLHDAPRSAVALPSTARPPCCPLKRWPTSQSSAGSRPNVIPISWVSEGRSPLAPLAGDQNQDADQRPDASSCGAAPTQISRHRLMTQPRLSGRLAEM